MAINKYSLSYIQTILSAIQRFDRKQLFKLMFIVQHICEYMIASSLTLKEDDDIINDRYSMEANTYV